MAVRLFCCLSVFLAIYLMSSQILEAPKHHTLLSKDVSALLFVLKWDRKVFLDRKSARLPNVSRTKPTPSARKLKIGLKLLHVSMAASYLVLLAGDVDLNPGPAICSVCKTDVKSNMAAVFCCSCDMAWHEVCSADICVPCNDGYICSSCRDLFDSSSSDSSSLYDFDSSLSDVDSTPNSGIDLENSQNSSSTLNNFNLNLSDKGLRYGFWNINHLTDSKYEQIKLLLCGSNKGQVDILFIFETFLKPHMPSSVFNVPGYQIFRKDRTSKAGGGVLVYVSDNLQLVKRRTDLESNDIEALWLDVCPFKSKRPILFGGIYRPPASTLENDKHLERNLEQACLRSNEIIVGGDFNINYLHKSSYTKHRLIKGIKSLNLTQLVSFVTRPISGTCLDLLFVNQPDRICDVKIAEIGLSDHLPIFGSRIYNRHITASNHKHKNITYRDMKHFDNKAFVSSIEKLPWDSAFVFDNIDDQLETWQKLFISAVDEHAPLKSKRVRKQRQPEWMSPDILKCINERDKLLKRARESNLVSDWNEYKLARNKATSILRDGKKRHFQSSLKNNRNNPRRLWKHIKNLAGLNTKSCIVNFIKVGDECFSKLKNIVEVFNTHFTSIAARLSSGCDDILPNFDKLRSFVNSNKISSEPFTIPKASLKDIAEILISIPSNKASGVDGISAKILKLAAPAVLHPLCRLINSSITMKAFPRVWKTARVQPLHKGDDPSCMGNYRPISVLPVLSKVMEKFVHASFYNYLRSNNLLYKYQSGFRAKYSTETALIKLVDQLIFNADKNMVTSAVFIDYCKAFDTVNHRLLLHKLEAYHLSPDSLTWFTSYLHERQQFVVIGDYSSSMLPLTSGVPQGSVLGPLLFLVYVNDLPFDSGEASVDIYADDTTVTAAADWRDTSKLSSTMSTALSSISNWTSENKLSINNTKTKSMLFASKRLRAKLSSDDVVNISLPGSSTPLENVYSHKLLGITLDQDLSFDDHVDNLCKKLSKRIGLLKRIKNCLPFEERLNFYTATIKPVMMYGSTIWTLTSKSNLESVLKLQKRAARTILDKNNRARTLPIFNKLKWIPFHEEAEILRLCILFKRVNDNLPDYMSDFLIRNCDMNKRSTRFNDLNFVCPLYKYVTEAGRSFTVHSIKAWNSLPAVIKKSSSLLSFKNALFKMSLDKQLA